MTTYRRTLAAMLLAAAGCALTACSTPESKIESYNKRGQALLEKGDLVKARLEFQNALQLNPSAVPSLFGLAVVAERARDWRTSYQLLLKVVELQPNHLDALVKLGKLQVASGQLDKALETSEAARGIRADSPDVLGLRAVVVLKLNEPKKAVTLANEALAIDPRHIDSLVVLATERMQAGDADAAVAFMDKGLEANERNVSLQMLKVHALQKAGRTERAEEVLHKLVKLFPQDNSYRHLLASFYVQHRQPAKAEAEYRAVVAASPKESAPKLQLVQFVHGARGADAAAAELEAFSRAEPKSGELKLALANVRLQQKKDAEAVALWKEIIGGDDATAGLRARGSLAAYQITHGQKEPAKVLVEQMLAKDARDEQALFLRAGMAIEDGKHEDAVADLRTILRDTPDSARAHLVLAHTHELQGQRELAMQHYANAAQAGRFAPGFAMPYAEQLMRSGKARQAQGVLKELLRVSPGNVAGLKLLTQAYLTTGDLAEAQAIADQVANSTGAELAARQIRGAVQLARKDFGGGIASFKQAYELAPTHPQAMAAVAHGYLAAGKPKEAVSFLQAVVNTLPKNQDARLLHGQLLAQTGNLPAAIEAMEAAIQIDPANSLPHQTLVAAHMSNGNAAAAMAAAEKGLQSIPGDFGLRVARAGVLHMTGKVDEAIAAYDALLTERPNAALVANNLASLLADHRKDAASVRRAFDIAQRFRSTDIPQMKDTLGWATHLVGKHKDAADLLKSAASQSPNLAVVHYHYGMNQLALNNVENARQALRRSIELAKDSPFPQVEEARQTLQNL